MDKEILRNIGSIYRAINSFTDHIVKEILVDKGQYQFLLRIQENNNINQKALSSILQVDKATTAKAIKKLIEKGYVIKKKSIEDKRNFKLQITPEGEKICDFLIKEENFCTQAALKGLTKKDKEQMKSLLDKMKNNIGNIWSDVRKGKQDYYKNKIENGY